MLSFITSHTDGRIAFSGAAKTEAERLEAVAQQLELAFDSIISSMEAWQRYSDWVREQPPSDTDAAHRVALAAELRTVIADAFVFFRDEAAGDSLPEARRHLERIATVVEATEAVRLLPCSLRVTADTE